MFIVYRYIYVYINTMMHYMVWSDGRLFARSISSSHTIILYVVYPTEDLKYK